jgi:hypothetical protein
MHAQMRPEDFQLHIRFDIFAQLYPAFGEFKVLVIGLGEVFHAFESTCQKRFHPVGTLSTTLSPVR